MLKKLVSYWNDEISVPVAFFFQLAMIKKICITFASSKKKKRQNRSKYEKTIEISNNLYIFMVQRWKVHNKIFSNLRWIRKYVLPLHQKIKKTI